MKGEQSLRGLRCLGFGRASSDPQAETSIPQQEEALRARCREWEMVWVGFDHETVSATEPGNRDDIARLLERKRTRDDYDVLLLWDRSRLTRAGQEHGAWLKVEFGRVGVTVVARNAKMVGSRLAWIEEGLEDDAAHDYVVKLSGGRCRGRQHRIENELLPYTEASIFGIDRLHLNADGKAICIIRNLRDGRQQRLHPDTKELLETYPPEQKGHAKRHYRKQKTDKVVLVPGADDDVEMIRYIMERYYVQGAGYLRIAKEMNARGWKAPKGGRWATSTVGRIVHAPVYAARGISNVWATGKFNVCDRGCPKEVAYDLYKMMNRKRNKEVLRHPDNWVVKDYPRLQPILPDDLRDKVWQRQRDFLARRAQGLLAPPNRDKHSATSSFILKQVLRCKHSGMGLVGRSSGPRWRYYGNAKYINDPDPNRPWLGRLVPAKLVEERMKTLLKEVLAAPEVLTPLIREIVTQEATRVASSHNEIEKLQKEQHALDQQMRFALSELGEVGDDAVRRILQPLKERRHTLGMRLGELKAQRTAGQLDIDAIVESVVADFQKLGDGLDGLPLAVIRNLLSSFTRMEIDLEAWAINLDVLLPSWAIRDGQRIIDALSLVDRGCCPRGKETKAEAPVLTSYKCLLGQEKEGRYWKPCIQCSRRAA